METQKEEVPRAGSAGGNVPASPARRSAKEQFDRQAEHYDDQWNRWNQESLDWLLEHAGCRPTDKVLDVATGGGYTALSFAPHVASVVGLDVSAGMLAQARRRAEERGLGNVSFQEGNAEAMPFPDGTFDIVTCRIAPHHFASVERFVREAARVLRPGGRFLLADTVVPVDDPAAAEWQNGVEALRDPSHVRNLSADEWRRLAESAGLAVEALEGTGTIEVPLSAWLTKAGCSEELSREVRRRFQDAPPEAVRAFRITRQGEETFFTWHRVVLKTVRG